jgi:5-methyltetrahydrofolate--homocysteine methyltransferase
MNKNGNLKIRKLLDKRVLILDGAMGTQLQNLGMPQGECPEIWAMQNPDLVKKVHKDYLEAGSDIIYSCTFGANQIKLAQYGDFNVQAVNRKLALIAKQAAAGKALVAGDIGPSGKFVAPFGPLDFENAVGIFKQQVRGLLAGGVDLFVIETMMDIQEARAALIAVKELSDKFTIVTMTYENDQRTLNGTDPISALITLQSLGADAVGCNCSCGPKQMLKMIKTMQPYAKIPLVAKPNAGMPRLVKGMTVFNMKPEEFSSLAVQFAKTGVGLLGGCCGTNPEHIRALKQKLTPGKMFSKPALKSLSAVSSARGFIRMDKKRFTIVGECINPTGKKVLQQELKAQKMSLVRQLAKDQQAHGAHMLDVNAGVAHIDEKKTLEKMINLISITSNLPLVIDSSTVSVIEHALRIYPGRALVNSISAEKHKLKKLLPIAAKYGAMFVLLPLNDREVPETFKRRRQIALQIFNKAKKYGFTKDDIVIDGLCMTISSHPRAGLETLQTIKWAADVLKTNSICGLSNISFGMPKRMLMNSTFLSMLKNAGMSMVISNPLHKKHKFNEQAEKVLLGKDKNAAEYIEYCRMIDKKHKSRRIDNKSLSVEQKVENAIIDGNRDDIRSYVKQAVASGIKPHQLVQNIMIPAINHVGQLFDKKEFFLPQLIASAQAMKYAFEYLEPMLSEKHSEKTIKNVFILATVKGDIHDIGKNIVALLLKNHGFVVVDLGKDISAKKIIAEVKKHKQAIVGLSALMTTTMVNMKEVIGLARKEKLDCRFVVGGAVITKSFARSLGAEYAADGVEAVKVAKKLLSKK